MKKALPLAVKGVRFVAKSLGADKPFLLLPSRRSRQMTADRIKGILTRGARKKAALRRLFSKLVDLEPGLVGVFEYIAGLLSQGIRILPQTAVHIIVARAVGERVVAVVPVQPVIALAA